MSEPVVAGAPAPSGIEISGLTKSYAPGGAPVLDAIDLAIAPGELVTLLGPSGCGKSTLLRAIAGFVDPEVGSIRIDGVDITRTPTYRRGVGIVHQSHALWMHMSVAENVSFGLEMQGIDRATRIAKVTEMLELVGLGGLGERLPNQLSGGQQQRVALARALVVRPRVLLLDEPLSSLDANLRVYLRAEIRSIQRELGVTTIFVTHDREEAMAISDRIVVLEAGRIAQQGTPFEVYREPSTPFVMSLTGRSTRFPGVVVEAPPSGLVVDGELGQLPIAPAGSKAGDRVDLHARPEDLRLSDGLGAAATVIDLRFLGTSVEVIARTQESETTAEVRIDARSSADRLPSVGDRVLLTVDAAHVSVFPAE